MKKALVLAAGVFVAHMQIAAHAADLRNGYIGVNYLSLEQYNLYDFTGGDKVKTGDIAIRMGGYITENFSSEFRIGTSIKPYEETTNLSVPASEGEYKRDFMASAFLKAGYPVGAVTPYLAVGYTVGSERLEYAAGKDDDTFNDFSYGAGVDIHLGDDFGINLEFTQYYDVGAQKLKGPSAGAFWRF